MRYLLGLLVALTFFPTIGFATTTTDLDTAAKRGQHTYIMFFRANDNPTQQMASTIKSHIDKVGEKATWVAVNVGDPKQAHLVKRFNASRIPLPATFGVAPNGAVAGVFQQRVSAAQLSSAILTPKYSEMVKALQSQKIAVVAMMPAAKAAPPAGVTALIQDPGFKGIVHPVTAFAADPSEADFFARMQIDRNIKTPVVLMFAPPGTHLGTFPATTTGPQLAQKLHQSGKCNCSKCQVKR